MTGISRIADIAAGLFILNVCISTGAMAQDGHCDGGSMQFAVTCFNKLLDQADSELAAKYASAQTMLRHSDGESPLNTQLARTQDEWSTYRTETCDGLIGSYWQNGKGQVLVVASCKLALTRERISDLDKIFNGLWVTQ